MSDNPSAKNNNQEKGGKVKSRVEAPQQKVQTFTADNDWQTSGSFLEQESSDFLSGSAPAFGDGSPSLSVQRRSTTLPATSNAPQAAPNWNFSHIPTHSSARPTIQPKLMVGPANDQYEQEADRVAQQVMRMPAPVFAPNEGGQGSVQRQEEEDLAQMKPLAMKISSLQRQEDEEALAQMKPFLQRQGDEDKLAQMKPQLIQRDSAAGFATDDTFETNLNRQRGGGSPLPASLRDDFEPKFGADFSGVRVHTNGESHQLNQSIQAKAFTTGKDVFFRQGAYQPGSRGGQELIAHELTHVVQQTGGAVKESAPAVSRKTDRGIVQRKITKDGREVNAYELMVNLRSKFGSNTNFMDQYNAAKERYIEGKEDITLERLLAQMDEEEYELEDEDMDAKEFLDNRGESKEMMGDGASESGETMPIQKLVVLRRQIKAIRLGLQTHFGTDAFMELSRGLLEVGITVGSVFVPIPGMGEFAGQLMEQGLTTSVAATGGQALGGSAASATAKLSETAIEGPADDPFARNISQAETDQFSVSDEQATRGTTTSGRARQAYEASAFGTGGKVASAMMGKSPSLLKPAMAPFAATGAILGTAAHMAKDALWSKTLKPIGKGTAKLGLKAASQVSQSAANYQEKMVALDKGPVIEWLMHENGSEALRAAAKRYYAAADESIVSVSKRKNPLRHRDANALQEMEKVNIELKKLDIVLRAKHQKHWKTYWAMKQVASGKEQK